MGEYDLCQRMKNRMEEVAEKLKLSEVSKRPWTHLMVDFITKLLIVAGKDVILVVCDQLSKMTYFMATTEGTSAESLARLLLGIETRLLTAFHLQTDRQTEQMNQELEQYFWFFIDHRQKDWPEWLVSAEFAVNNKVHSATKMSPFMANYGRELRMGGDIREK